MNGLDGILFNAPQTVYRTILNKTPSVSRAIIEIAKTILKASATMLHHPRRYTGSKTWSLVGLSYRLPIALLKRLVFTCEKPLKAELFGSGYRFSPKKTLCQEQTKALLPYICMANATQNTNAQWTTPIAYRIVPSAELPGIGENLEVHNYSYTKISEAFKAVIFEKENDIVISFGALHSLAAEFPDETDKKSALCEGQRAGVENLIGLKKNIYNTAVNFVENVSRHPRMKGKKITLLGQCLGGSLAQNTALKLKKQAICLNTLPIGVGQQQRLGQEALLSADRYVTHINVKGDWYCDSLKPIDIADRVMNFLGLRTPGCFGRRYAMPTPYPWYDNKNVHCFIFRSAFWHLGYSPRASLEEVLQTCNINKALDPTSEAFHQLEK